MNSPPIETKSLDFRIHQLIEDVFKITIDRNRIVGTRVQPLVYLEEAAAANEKPLMDVDSLEHALFERLLLEDSIPQIINTNNNLDLRVTLNECITYLFECYKDISLYRANIGKDNPEWKKTIDHVIKLIVRNAATALKQPDLYSSQNIHSQVVNVFFMNNIAYPDELVNFFKDVTTEMREDENGIDFIHPLLEPVLETLRKELQSGSILILPVVSFNTLEAFAKIPDFALAVVKESIPSNKRVGGLYAQKLLGTLFSISSLPNRPEDRDENFDKNSIMSDGNLIAKKLWSGLENLSMRLHRITLGFLKASPEVRDLLLIWFGECIQHNAPRKQVWGRMMQQVVPVIPDGFALNLCSVLLRLCGPFIKPANNPKLLKIDPTYCAVETEADFESKKVHLKTLHSETCLVPVEENEKRLVAQKEYSFITECFFMTHSALELGVKPCLDRLTNLIQDVGRMQEIFQTDHQNMRNLFEEGMQSYLIKCFSLRTVLLEPSFITYLGDFHRASCTWLVQLMLDPDESSERDSFAPLEYRDLNSLKPSPPNTLKCVPEFVFENLCSYLVLLRRFHPMALEEKGPDFLEPVLTALIVYMGSNKLVRNPHLRARLAECMDCLLPTPAEIVMPDIAGNRNQMNFFYRTKLFNDHPYRHQAVLAVVYFEDPEYEQFLSTDNYQDINFKLETTIIPSLLDVFVGIEMTGQSVQFEQKFNYRRPMYKIMDYLWTLEEQKQVFKNLAMEAEQNMEAVNPPLFLRFINILMNDAIFLLDEALSNMAQLKQMQNARDNNEWDSLPQHEREQNMQQMAHIGMIARFDNILGMNTITTLQYLTEEIKTIFCHNTMVDRIAAMLNYFLLHLVGPKKKNFKVKDMNEYKFEPGTIVRRICAIYVHLGSSDVFCAAVSRDGRSYSPQLFEQAANVLVRVQGAELLQDLQNLSKHVADLANQQRTEEGLLAEAPDDFLDPIMSTLMTDPVMLPSSRQIVDRSTIARHLLSDQTDPFNRSPLTMDMVKPDLELKRKIDEWIQEKRAGSS